MPSLTKRALVAVTAALGVAVVTGVPTDLIDTPWFGREIPPPSWSYPVWIATAALSGALIASYVGVENGSSRPSRWGGIGGVTGFLAIGCPVCNKLVLLALGTSGALTWFEPIQPLLGLVALGLLAVALRMRFRTVCPAPRTTTEPAPSTRRSRTWR